MKTPTKNSLKISALLVFVMASSILLSCQKKGNDKLDYNSMIIGTWNFSATELYFQPNGGTKSLVGADTPDPRSYYQFKTGGVITSEIFNEDGSSEKGSGTYTINGSKLTVRETGGTTSDMWTITQLDDAQLELEGTEKGSNGQGVAGTFTWIYKLKK